MTRQNPIKKVSAAMSQLSLDSSTDEINFSTTSYTTSDSHVRLDTSPNISHTSHSNTNKWVNNEETPADDPMLPISGPSSISNRTYKVRKIRFSQELGGMKQQMTSGEWTGVCEDCGGSVAGYWQKTYQAHMLRKDTIGSVGFSGQCGGCEKRFDTNFYEAEDWRYFEMKRM